MQKRIYPVEGMMCAGCASGLEQALRKATGVQSASVSYASGTATICFDPALTAPSQLQKTAEQAGYALIIAPNEQNAPFSVQLPQEKTSWRHTAVALLIALIVMMINMWYSFAYHQWVQCLLTGFSLALFGRGFFVGAYKQLCHGSANMDTLVALSTGTGWAYSTLAIALPHYFEHLATPQLLYFESAAMIVGFILLGKQIEARAKGRTRSSIAQLLALAPAMVRVKRGEEYSTIPLSHAAVGDEIRVLQGEKIPVDGTIIAGKGLLEESLLTGEAVPVEKGIGEKVYAGTVLSLGSISIQAEQVGEGTLLWAIVQAVRTAQSSKPTIQHLADRVAAVMVPAVLLTAIGAASLWYLLRPNDGLALGLHAFITILVIACPCALGLATPTALMVGIGKAAQTGILIRDAESLEQSTALTDIVLDKTGTLTTGTPQLTGAYWQKSPDELLPILVGLACCSLHPFSKAIAKHYEGISPLQPDNFEEEVGKGSSGIFGGKQYSIRSLYRSPWQAQQWAKSIAKLHPKSTLIALVEQEAHIVGILALDDAPKQSAKQSIEKLRAMNLAVHLLSGDNPYATEWVAQQVGIAHYLSGQSPQEKRFYIEKLQAQGKKVAMVGDGSNDSPAMAQATMSIALGGGSEVAISTAAVTIMGDNLLQIPQAIALARLTTGTIYRNFFWAFLYNLIALPIAAGVLYPNWGILLSPMAAAGAMAMSSISVLLSSLALGWKYDKMSKKILQ